MGRLVRLFATPAKAVATVLTAVGLVGSLTCLVLAAFGVRALSLIPVFIGLFGVPASLVNHLAARRNERRGPGHDRLNL